LIALLNVALTTRYNHESARLDADLQYFGLE
jgi:hypothetical protein